MKITKRPTVLIHVDLALFPSFYKQICNMDILIKNGKCIRTVPAFTRAWWRHQMETFSALLAICAGNSPVPGEFPTQRPVNQWAWINGRVNNREAGDLRRYRAHYDVTVMEYQNVELKLSQGLQTADFVHRISFLNAFDLFQIKHEDFINFICYHTGKRGFHQRQMIMQIYSIWDIVIKTSTPVHVDIMTWTYFATSGP